MKKKLILFLVVLICLFLSIKLISPSQVHYEGESSNWKSYISFDKDNMVKVSMKYLGVEEFPIETDFTIKYLSGNSSSGIVEYSDGFVKLGGFYFESEYDSDIHGNMSYALIKNNLTITLNWNDKEETLILKKSLI